MVGARLPPVLEKHRELRYTPCLLTTLPFPSYSSFGSRCRLLCSEIATTDRTSCPFYTPHARLQHSYTFPLSHPLSIYRPPRREKSRSARWKSSHTLEGMVAFLSKLHPSAPSNLASSEQPAPRYCDACPTRDRSNGRREKFILIDGTLPIPRANGSFPASGNAG